jgi:hypothetical protein
MPKKKVKQPALLHSFPWYILSGLPLEDTQELCWR